MNKIKFLKRSNPLIYNGIAHRGLHDAKLCENGIPSFLKAIKHNIPIELDVHLSKDNHLIVCHDSSLKRTTLKEGIIEELTLEEIKNNYSLIDGTKVPTLLEVLSLVNEKVPLVIELKTYKLNNTQLAKALINELKDRIINPANYMIIAFDPRALFPLKKLRLLRVLLIAEERYDVFFFRHFFDGIDIEDKLLTKRKVINYTKKHFSNVWTIEDKNKLSSIPQSVDTLTFQHIEPTIIKENLNNNYNLTLKKEISYGGVIYKIKENKIYYLIEHMNLGHISLCKGHVEKGESPLMCAKREIKEETNQDVKIDSNFKYKISYYPKKNIYKDVIFFLCEIISNNTLSDLHDDEVNISELVEYKKAIKLLTHSSDKKVLKSAHLYLLNKLKVGN